MAERADGARGLDYEELLREQADRLNRLKVARGNPSLRAIDARARELFGAKASLPIATQNAAFRGKYVGIDRLTLLVRTLLSWDEYGEKLDRAPDRRSPELEEWRRRWTSITIQRQGRGRSGLSVERRRAKAEAVEAPRIPAARDPERASHLMDLVEAAQGATVAEAEPAGAEEDEDQDGVGEAEESSARAERLTVPETLKLLFSKIIVCQIVRCTVVAMNDDGVGVQLDGGVPGIIELRELASPTPDKPSDVVEIGDEVFAEIQDVVCRLGTSFVVLSSVAADATLGDDPAQAEFDPTRYGMAADYDREGNYVYPEGFDPGANDWLPGFEEERAHWELRYATATSLFEAHQRHVLARLSASELNQAGEDTDVVEDSTRALDADDPATLDARHDLAIAQGEAGDAAGAAAALAGLLPVDERVRGVDDPSTLHTRHSYAHWTGEAGDAAGAAEMLASVVEDRTRVLGADDPATLASQRSLAHWTEQAQNQSRQSSFKRLFGRG
ncbi:S1 RNA-binding domain-containing protein (plasmid) [Streptomyces cellulosae]|uniref:S1 RNA-binding domain-containing protein n=1 Tax=Streptomyces cellulosae TaxID=1968 RepID=UPI002ED490E4|nr:S1 RNA-binding domain-containing protein [Streptomyces cellulosae]